MYEFLSYYFFRHCNYKIIKYHCSGQGFTRSYTMCMLTYSLSTNKKTNFIKDYWSFHSISAYT